MEEIREREEEEEEEEGVVLFSRVSIDKQCFVQQLDGFISWLQQALDSTDNWTQPRQELDSLRAYLDTHLRHVHMMLSGVERVSVSESLSPSPPDGTEADGQVEAPPPLPPRAEAPPPAPSSRGPALPAPSSRGPALHRSS
ncbi:A-kinase anchor protein 6 [Liparis tanakae]|uniref:A-kinase anchor protein 6 n=1 Tax=Liparis tanakae TaxID=230148 RepID=A0A4Z2H0W2_9TELE|nr:A-kinase anchor protein 6 [Liparis tanakae]